MGYVLWAMGPIMSSVSIGVWQKYILDKALAGPVLFRTPAGYALIGP